MNSHYPYELLQSIQGSVYASPWMTTYCIHRIAGEHHWHPLCPEYWRCVQACAYLINSCFFLFLQFTTIAVLETSVAVNADALMH